MSQNESIKNTNCSPFAVVVNDDHIQLKVLSELLHKVGLESRIFTGAEEALAQMSDYEVKPDNIHAGLPSIIITDLYMPGIDGWRFCRLLRSPEYASLNKVPILVVSATYTGDEPNRIAKDLGVDAFMPSNVDGKQFIEQVDAILKGRQIDNRPHVLIVDDSTVIIDILKKAFEANGYKVDSATTAKQASLVFNMNVYDVAVIDYHLSDGMGDTLLDMFRIQHPECACLMMTSNTQKTLALNWMKRGAAAYLLKPFEPEYLIELCARARRERSLLYVQDMLDIRTRELIESEKKYRSLFQGSRDGFVMVDKTGLIIEVNKAFCDMLGYAEDELKNIKDFYKLTPTRWHKWEEEEIWKKRLLKNGYSGVYEKEYIRKDGSIVPVEIQSYTVFYDNGDINYLWGVTRDITERKQLEDAMHKSEALLLDAQRLAGLGSWELNLVSKSLEWSSEVYRIFELDPKKFVPSYNAFLSVIHPDDRDAVNQAYTSSLAIRQPYSITHRLLMSDGRIKYVHEKCETFYNDEGQPLRSLGTIQDITERKQSEEEREKLREQLNQAHKMEAMGTLAGGIAHDFNNILSPIIGHTELMIDDVPEDSTLRSSLDEIKSASMRAKELVNQILTFSRQEQSELKLMKMQHIIKEALSLVRSGIPTTIEIIQDIRPDCRAVKADPTQIHQIVMNLTTNAYHAMEETGGKLKVSLKEVQINEKNTITSDIKFGNYACLTVSDTGVGIDKELVEKIFEPFFTTKERGKGTGMGLSVVHGIVKNAGGGIKVLSEPGKGTEINVYLPIAENYTQTHDTQTGLKEIRKRGFEKILLVDDEEIIIKIVRQLLERLGYHVISFISSIEALEAFRANPANFNLVITDMAMPNMSGEKLAIELNKIRNDIPILLLTGFRDIITPEKAASIGIKGVLTKPIVLNDFASKIREVLDMNKVSLLEENIDER